MAETDAQRIRRITNAILAGERDLESVRRGVDSDLGRTPQPSNQGALANDQAIIATGDRAQVEARVRAIFANRGYRLDETGRTASDLVAEFGLQDLGLAGLSDFVWESFLDGASPDEIWLEIQKRPEYQQRFPGMGALREQGQAISEARYVELERSYQSVMRSAGIPEHFYDAPSDFGRLIAGGVSPEEFSRRVEDGYLRVAQAPPEVREVFADWFGPQGEVALAAFYMDPDWALPKLERMTTQAQIAGSGRRFGVNIDRDQAGSLADLGVTEAGANQGFQQIEALSPLLTESVSEQSDFTAEREGVAAVFGTGGDAARKLERRRQSRSAALSGGGGAEITQRGIIGLGAAQ